MQPLQLTQKGKFRALLTYNRRKNHSLPVPDRSIGFCCIAIPPDLLPQTRSILMSEAGRSGWNHSAAGRLKGCHLARDIPALLAEVPSSQKGGDSAFSSIPKAWAY
jgi:hypothetical protein